MLRVLPPDSHQLLAPFGDDLTNKELLFLEQPVSNDREMWDVKTEFSHPNLGQL